MKKLKRFLSKYRHHKYWKHYYILFNKKNIEIQFLNDYHHFGQTEYYIIGIWSKHTSFGSVYCIALFGFQLRFLKIIEKIKTI